jgi:hypothetical protein
VRGACATDGTPEVTEAGGAASTCAVRSGALFTGLFLHPVAHHAHAMRAPKAAAHS